MRSSTTPMAVKMAIYSRFLSGDLTRVVAQEFVISHPTALKYANEAVEKLKSLAAGDELLEDFLSAPLKLQVFQYPDRPEIQVLLTVLLVPLLEGVDRGPSPVKDRAKISVTARISAVADAILESQVSHLRQNGEDYSKHRLISDLLEEYAATGVLPLPAVTKPLGAAIQEDILSAINVSVFDVLTRHGIV